VKNDPFDLRERSGGNRYATLFRLGLYLGSAGFPRDAPGALRDRTCSF